MRNFVSSFCFSSYCMRVFPDFLKLFLSVCLEAAASSPRKKKRLLFGILSISMFTIKRWLLLKPDLLWSYIYVYIFIVILCSCSFLFIIIFKFYVFFTLKNPLGRMRIWALPRLTHPKMEQETNVRSSAGESHPRRAGAGESWALVSKPPTSFVPQSASFVNSLGRQSEKPDSSAQVRNSNTRSCQQASPRVSPSIKLRVLKVIFKGMSLFFPKNVKWLKFFSRILISLVVAKHDFAKSVKCELIRRKPLLRFLLFWLLFLSNKRPTGLNADALFLVCSDPEWSLCAKSDARKLSENGEYFF